MLLKHVNGFDLVYVEFGDDLHDNPLEKWPTLWHFHASS